METGFAQDGYRRAGGTLPLIHCICQEHNPVQQTRRTRDFQRQLRSRWADQGDRLAGNLKINRIGLSNFRQSLHWGKYLLQGKSGVELVFESQNA